MQIFVDGADESHPVSFIMIDIDDFKKINDEYGHLIGDDVLKMVAGKMRQIVGEKGFSIRYGGDEFSILMRDRGLEEAQRIARELHSQIGAYVLKVHQGTLQMSVSMGVATAHERMLYKNLIQQADDLLRRSKKRGKNQISDNTT
jgi:two-component system cell cycle response regulator